MVFKVNRKSICKEKFNILYEKKNLENHIGKISDFYIEIFIFIVQNAIYTFYNLYCDNRDLITKFWPGSTKWNTPFTLKFIICILKNTRIIICSPKQFNYDLASELGFSGLTNFLSGVKRNHPGALVWQGNVFSDF